MLLALLMHGAYGACVCFACMRVQEQFMHAYCWRGTHAAAPECTQPHSSTCQSMHLAQVIGPEAAQAWLAEVALPLGLHYYFAHCHDFDTKPGLARPWLMKHLGALDAWGALACPCCPSLHTGCASWPYVLESEHSIIRSKGYKRVFALALFGEQATTMARVLL